MENTNKFLIPAAILIAGALIAWGVSSQNNSSPRVNKGGDIPTTQKIELSPISENDHILGNPDADILLVEYSDLECPYCKRFHFTTKKLMEDYGKNGKLAIVFRNFPLDQLHSKARKEAIATECSAKLGGNEVYWEYLNKLFETTPSNNGLDLSLLSTMAKEVGLDKTEFEACLEDKKIAEKVEGDYQSGVKAGVLGTRTDPGGTPYSILLTKDGGMTKIKGAQQYETVKLMIEQILGTHQ